MPLCAGFSYEFTVIDRVCNAPRLKQKTSSIECNAPGAHARIVDSVQSRRTLYFEFRIIENCEKWRTSGSQGHRRTFPWHIDHLTFPSSDENWTTLSSSCPWTVDPFSNFTVCSPLLHPVSFQMFWWVTNLDWTYRLRAVGRLTCDHIWPHKRFAIKNRLHP